MEIQLLFPISCWFCRHGNPQLNHHWNWMDPLDVVSRLSSKVVQTYLVPISVANSKQQAETPQLREATVPLIWKLRHIPCRIRRKIRKSHLDSLKNRSPKPDLIQRSLRNPQFLFIWSDLKGRCLCLAPRCSITGGVRCESISPWMCHWCWPMATGHPHEDDHFTQIGQRKNREDRWDKWETCLKKKWRIMLQQDPRLPWGYPYWLMRQPRGSW